MRQSSLRRVFHFRGIATQSHTGRPRTCLVIISDPRRGRYMVLPAFLFYFFFFFFRHDFVRAISLEPSLVETPNGVCCLVLRSNFALFLTMQFVLLISLLINIISLDVTSFNSAVTLKLKCGKVVCVVFFFHFRGIATRSHTGRPRTCLVNSSVTTSPTLAGEHMLLIPW